MSDVMRQLYSPITKDTALIIKGIKQNAAELHDIIDALGDSRELSIAKTKLEEAVMWAVKHLT